MEAVVVCEPSKPPRLCHTENQPEVRKTATQKRARGARAVLCAVHAVRLFPPNSNKAPDSTQHGKWQAIFGFPVASHPYARFWP